MGQPDYGELSLMRISRMNLTHMVIKVYYGQVLGRMTRDLRDFAETSKVLLDCVLFVEGWRQIPALDGVAVGRRHAAEALPALPACTTFHRGYGFTLRVRGFC